MLLKIGIKNFQEKLTANLEIKLNDQLIKQEQVKLNAFSEILKTFDVGPLEPGKHKIQAKLIANGEELDELNLTIAVKGKEKGLLLSGSLEDQKLLKPVAISQGIELESHINSIPELELSDYKFVILNNIANNKLPVNFNQKISDFVLAGGSLMMTGGNQSFGLGGYQNSKIAELLPVKVVDPEKKKKRLNLAVSLILDKSGSMKENAKLEYTKIAAKELLKTLKPEDYIGVIGFDEAPFVALKLERIATARQKAMQRIDLLFPGRSTRLLPALKHCTKTT